MSNKHITWARAVSGVSAVSKSVLLLLADSADSKGECFPSVPTLARELSRSGRCVQKHLRQLESRGLISIRQRYVDSGRQSSSVYQLNMQVAPGSFSESETRTGRVNPIQGEGESCAGGRVNLVQGEGERDSSPYLEPSCEPSKETGALPAGAPARGERLPPPDEPSKPAAPAAKPPQEPAPQRKTSPSASGCRLPDDWTPKPEDRQYAVELGLDVDAVLEGFRDYWTDKAGPSALRVSWSGTWRGWCRREQQDLSSGSRGQGWRLKQPGVPELSRGDRIRQALGLPPEETQDDRIRRAMGLPPETDPPNNPAPWDIESTAEEIP